MYERIQMRAIHMCCGCMPCIVYRGKHVVWISIVYGTTSKNSAYVLIYMRGDQDYRVDI